VKNVNRKPSANADNERAKSDEGYLRKNFTLRAEKRGR